MAYYRRIRDLREDNDYTQSYVAKILGITQQQYSLYESGRRDIPTTALLALADLYNTTTDYILGREI
ncbi:MAG: helix-turn-helix transcriptional regulator [Clostridia bacterium]|nr:helix-turn-helix transcriptional regulator [Clostridia bacterium]